MPTTYTIIETDEAGREKYFPLTARTDDEATAVMRKYRRRNARSVLHLTFSRSEDGQCGYLNPDGNAYVTGRAW